MISFVYPNTSELNRRGRGGLEERRALAEKSGCRYVEVPADLIKNQTEVALTGLPLGSFLTANAIARLYSPSVSPCDVRYIFHTEPSLPRSDGTGLNHQAPIQWYDTVWVSKLCDMLVDVGRHLGVPPAIVEIHPGDRRNSINHVLRSARVILERLKKAFSTRPLILLENRTDQFLSTGSDLETFGRSLNALPDLRQDVGIVLDVQQLFTRTRGRLLEELECIPANAVRGLHIHSKHRTPSEADAIPWVQVFEWVDRLPGEFLINPEVHHRAQVAETISFCSRMSKSINKRVVADESG